MRQFTVNQVRVERDAVYIRFHDGDPDAQTELAMPAARLSACMAEYGITDPAEAMDLLLHTVMLARYMDTLAAADDPAAVAGWVTTTDADSEPIHLYNARSTSDAAGAYRCRIDAVKAQYAHITDPDGHLAGVPAPDLDHVYAYREAVDTARWQAVYGDLPIQIPRRAERRIPMQQRG